MRGARCAVCSVCVCVGGGMMGAGEHNPAPLTSYLSEPADIGFDPTLAVGRCYLDQEIQQLKVVPHMENWLEQQLGEHVPHGHPEAGGLPTGIGHPIGLMQQSAFNKYGHEREQVSCGA